MNLNQLDLNLLRVFDAIYGARNVSAAATLLGMRQSAVSAALARMRHLSGDHLFVRSGQGVKPTYRADAMAGPIREGLARLDRAFSPESAFNPAELDRTFRLTSHEMVEPFVLRALIGNRVEAAPKVRFQAISIPPEGVADGLYNGKIELALDTVPLQARQITCLPAFRVRWMCAGRRGWAERHGTLDRQGFQNAPFVALKRRLHAQDIVDRALSRIAGNRHVVYETASYWSMATAVAESEVLAVLPRVFFNEVADPLKLEELPLPFELPDEAGYLIWHDRSSEDQGHRWLRRLVLARLAQQSEGVGAAS